MEGMGEEMIICEENREEREMERDGEREEEEEM